MKKKMFVLLALLLLSNNMIFSSSLYKKAISKKHSLYSNEQAKGIGDIITVLITENSSAAQNVQTQSNGTMNASLSQGTGLFNFISGNLASSTNNSVGYNGKGTNQRSGNINATISATIIEVLDNGYYKVQGIRKIKISEEEQEITVTGIIRPEDIEDNNTINSNKIAEAKIEYSGNGSLSITQKPGLFTRVLHWLF
jgi:flagellar L-ring protein precursor FlgH